MGRAWTGDSPESRATPTVEGNMVYVTGGYDTGGMMVKIGDDGKSATVVWTDPVLDDHHGGVVMVNGYIYGSNWINNSTGNWCCIDWKTGKKIWEEKWNCKGSIISAEGMLYIYEEKNGNIELLKANPATGEINMGPGYQNRARASTLALFSHSHPETYSPLIRPLSFFGKIP
jgi:hypothetical protein